MQRFALGVAHHAPFGRGALAAGPPRPHAQLVEKTERIRGAAAVRTEPVATVRLAPVHPHFPSRAVTGNGLLLIARDRVIAHSGEKIVGLVVFANVLQAEAPIFALTQPAFRRAMRRALVASRPVAARAVGAHAPILAGLDPDTVEQGRTDLHGRRLCGPEGTGRKLDKRFLLVPQSLFRNWMRAAPAAFAPIRQEPIAGPTGEDGQKRRRRPAYGSKRLPMLPGIGLAFLLSCGLRSSTQPPIEFRNRLYPLTPAGGRSSGPPLRTHAPIN